MDARGRGGVAEPPYLRARPAPRLRPAPLVRPAPVVRPRLTDDGRAVTLDLHGARVDEALDLVDALVAEAARRGRTTVRVIHGASTSGAGQRTIKSALHEALDAGDFAPYVTSSFRQDGAVLLGVAPAPAPLPGRLTLGDLTAPPHP